MNTELGRATALFFACPTAIVLPGLLICLLLGLCLLTLPDLVEDVMT